MNESTRQKLLTINREFYEQFGASFSGTRFGAQPGWDRIIHYFPRQGAVLDLGCGNGRLALFLEAKCGALATPAPPEKASAVENIWEEADSWSEVRRTSPIRYTGLDGSEALLAIARAKTASLQHLSTQFFAADLSSDAWPPGLGRFHVVTALAVLHHIPGFQARQRFLQNAAAHLLPAGVLILSNWRFTHNPRMRRKILPWAAAGLSQEDVEPGDFLLDWKKDGGGLRYAHQLDEAEVEALAAGAGLRVVEQFVADGREGDLSLYSICYPNLS